MPETRMTEPDERIIAQFAEVARRYCAWAECSDNNPSAEMRNARRILSELYLHAIELPDVFDEDAPDAESVPNEAFVPICRRLGELPISTYWQIFDPLEDPPDGGAPEPVVGGLGDDLGDIYRDLKEGFSLFDKGYTLGAGWEWRFGFLHHWGEHLVTAQRAIHRYFAEYRDSEVSNP